MDELLALIGQHWRLLLLYPGGLSAMGAVILDGWLMGGNSRGRRMASFRELPVLCAWLVAASLLPLPRTDWPYSPDLLSLLLLIELPFWTIALRTDEDRGKMLAAALNVYPLIALAVAALGLGAGSLVVREINRSAGWLHWLGIVSWSLALPPLLGLGPWRAAQPTSLLMASRRVGHLALLLAASLPAHESTPWWTVPFGYAAVVLPLALLDRRWRGSPDRWEPWQAALSAGGLALLALVSTWRLWERFG